MNQDTEDSSLLETQQISDSHPDTTTPSFETPVEDANQTLIETTDTSISNSWTILSTSDELQADMEGDNHSLIKDNQTTDANSNSVVEQQDSVSIGPEGDGEINQSNTESWLQVDDINKSESLNSETVVENETTAAVVSETDDGKSEPVVDEETVETESKPEPASEETAAETALPSEDVTQPKSEASQDVDVVQQSADDLVQTEEAEIPVEPTVVVDSEEKSEETTDEVSAPVEQTKVESEEVTSNDKPSDTVDEPCEEEEDKPDDWVDILGK